MKYRSRLGAPDIVKSVILWLGSVCFLSLLLTQCRGQSLPSQATYDVAKVEIDASKQAAYKIPRTIFGTFLEPIGNSTYGGLWADVLENPSLEEGLWSAA